MPYRRLPKTDRSRIDSLTKTLQKAKAEGAKSVLDYASQNELVSKLQKFNHSVSLYAQTYEAQVSANKKYQTLLKNARLYISHFIQVLNLAVIRQDIKEEHKLLYGLDKDNYTVPDLSSESAVLDWGKKIIEGESARTSKGGAPMYNPPINRVKVHYDIFKDYKISQKIFQASTTRNHKMVSDMRDEVDIFIKHIWDLVEASFANLGPYSKVKKCEEYGLIYYYRRGEAILTPEDDNRETE